MNLIIINYNNKKIKIWSDICITSPSNQSKFKKKIKKKICKYKNNK